MTYVDPNGQAATWLKNNSLDALYTGLMGLSFVPGLNIVASIGMMTIDLAKGDYTALAMDSLGIVIPGAAVGAKLGYDGVRAVVDMLKISDRVANLGLKLSDGVSIMVDTSRAIKSGIQVGGAKAALRAIESVNKTIPGPELSSSIGTMTHGVNIAPNTTEKLQMFVKKFDEGSSGINVSIPSSKDDFAKFFDETDSETFSKIFNDGKYHKKIVDRLRNWPKGQHEWLKVSRADEFKSWGVTFDEINLLRTPTKDVKFIDENGNIGAHHNTHAGKWAHTQMDKMIDESSSLDEYAHMLAEWSETHVVNGRNGLPEYFRDK